MCLVTRHGRLGWCLSEALGSSNAELDEQLQEITAAVCQSSQLPGCSAVCALDDLQEDCTTRPRTPRQRQHYLEQRLLEIEEAAWIEDLVDAVAKCGYYARVQYYVQHKISGALHRVLAGSIQADAVRCASANPAVSVFSHRGLPVLAARGQSVVEINLGPVQSIRERRRLVVTPAPEIIEQHSDQFARRRWISCLVR